MKTKITDSLEETLAKIAQEVMSQGTALLDGKTFFAKGVGPMQF